MKIKKMLILDLFVICIAFIYGLIMSFGSRGEIDGVGFLLLVLIVPQVIIAPPLFWYVTLSKILKSAGDERAITKKIGLAPCAFVMFCAVMVLAYFYVVKFKLLDEDLIGNALVCLIMVSHSIAISTAVLTAVAAYTIFINVGAIGYKKLIK